MHILSLLLLRCHHGNWSRDLTASMRSELLVVHEKLGQFSLLTVMLCLCKVRNTLLSTFETAQFFCACPVYNMKISVKWIIGDIGSFNGH
jgi:hypothetical protein